MAKPSPSPCTAAEVGEHCRAADWPLTPEQADNLAVYLDLLMRWNRAMNLVGAHSWTEALERLVFDSFELARFLEKDVLPERITAFPGQADGAPFPISWDLGAGAGLPGLPLRMVWPQGEYWLVEAREKRALFLSTVLTRVSLPNTHVFRGRAETFMAGQQADLVLSRAFMPWREVLRLTRDYLAPGGRVILLTRDTVEPETGWRTSATHTYQVGSDTRRLYAMAAEPA